MPCRQDTGHGLSAGQSGLDEATWWEEFGLVVSPDESHSATAEGLPDRRIDSFSAVPEAAEEPGLAQP